MTPHGPVFERNLEQLLQRCYVPVRARPRFESELQTDFLEEFARQNERWTRRRRALSRPSFSWIGPAAAAAAVLMVAWLLVPSEPEDAPSPPETVARVEHRFGPDQEFRLTDEIEHFDADWPETFYEVRTGADGRGAIVLAEGGSVELLPGTQLAARREGDERRARLVEGSASFGKSDATPDWNLLADAAHIRFERGELALHLDGELEVFLASGRAVLLTGSGPVVLPLGSSKIVDGLLDGVALGAISPPAAATRAAAEVTEEPEPVALVEEAEVRRLRGRVVAPDGRPVPRFRVHLLLEQDYSNVTNPHTRTFESEDGFWIWEEAPIGRHHVYVEASEFAVWRSSQPVETAGVFVDVEDARLDPGLRIRGTVRDRASGVPVEGAAVVSEADLPVAVVPIDSEQLRSMELTGIAHTGPDGTFELAHVSRGKQILRASSIGYGPAWSRVLEAEPGEEELEFHFELEPGATVTGHVYQSDGFPWAGADLVATTVDMAGRQERMSYSAARTDELGFFSIPDLPRSLMVVVLLGSESENDTGFPPQVQPVNLTGRYEATVDFGSAAVGTRLFGRLIAPDGEPLRRVPISILHESADARGGSEGWIGGASDDDGKYTFAQVRPGVNQVCVTSDMGESVTVVDTVDVPDWLEFEHDVQLGENRIHGTVHDAVGAPVFYAAVIAEQLSEAGDSSFVANAMSNLDGSYSLRYLEPGRYRVTVYPTTDQAPKAVPEVEVSAGARETEVSVVLDEGAVLELTVVDTAGRPVPDAVIFLAHPTTGELYSPPFFSTTDAEGKLRLLPGAAGRLTLEVRKPGFSPTRSEWNLRVGTQKGRVVLGP